MDADTGPEPETVAVDIDSYSDRVDILIEVIEVLTNQVLHARQCYPHGVFKTARIYNAPVYMPTFSPLKEYLRQVWRSALELGRAEELRCVELIFYTDESECIERYLFNFNETKLSLSKRTDDEFLLRFEHQLRNAVYRIYERVNRLPKLPADVSFKVLLHTDEASFTRMSHNPCFQNFPWLRLHAVIRTDRPPHNDAISIMPLSTVDELGLALQLQIIDQ